MMRTALYESHVGMKGRMVPFQLKRGEDLQKVATNVVGQPKEVVAGVREILGR